MRSILTTGIASTLFVVALGACRSGSNVGPPAPASPAASAEVKTNALASTDMHVVLSDPRLAAVRTLERAKDYAGAARALQEARAAAGTLSKGEACGWDYVEGRLWHLAGTTPLEAAAAFQRAEDAACPLAPYATLRRSQALARAGRADDAIAAARSVPEDLACKDDAKLVIAESLSAKGDRAGALPLWRSWLAANPHGNRWVDTSVRLANALVDGLAGPPEEHAREAYDAATRVVVEAPKLAESSGATAARARAVGALKTRDPSASDALTDTERATQAQAWLDTGEAQKAFDAASALLAKRDGAACRAAITRANAAVKAKLKVDAWTDAVQTCEKDEQLVTALYSGAKAKGSKDLKQALEWFGKVEQLFPAHRLADDARFRGALLLRDSAEPNHEERSEEMLRTLPDTYPAGDMRTEALFRVALAKMQRADFDGAKPHLDRILEIAPDDRHWATAGRAEYFRARVAAKAGDAEGARSRLVHVVEKHPLTFYMLLAYARLAAEDPAYAKRVLEDAVAKDKEGAFPSRTHAIVSSAGFSRARRLLEVGEIDAAKRELTAAGALADGVDPEVVWMVGALYNQAEAPELGHAFSRARLTDFLEHWPEGKWRTPWQVAYPRAFEPLVVGACGQSSLPTTLAWAIMREESSFVAEAKSPSNAYGLMQLIVPTAKWVSAGTGLGSDEASLKKPEVSISLGVKLLAQLRTKHWHPALAIGAYNAGSGAVDRWMNARSGEDLDLFVELIPYDETRNYVKRVLSSQAAYAYLYDPTSLSETLGLSMRLRR